MTSQAFKVGTGRRLKKSACLSCVKEMDGASEVGGNNAPTPGSITICISCGHIMAFADDLSFRELTDSEKVEIAGDPRIIAVQKARKAMLSSRGATA